MNPPPPDDARAEAAVWQAMVLFSTLSTAAQVWRAAQARRAGHDPSEQEAAAFVRPYLRAAGDALQGVLMQLQASRIQAQRGDEASIAALVRRYDELTALRRAGHHLQVIHQRLLSLYPDVAEALVEEARRLHGTSSALLEAGEETFQVDVGPFLRRTLVFTGSLHRAVQ